MTKEIDQKKYLKKMYIPCSCGSNHSLLFEYANFPKPGAWKEFYIGLMFRPYRNLFERIKTAFKFVFKGEDIWHEGISITKSDMNRIEKMFEEYRNL